MSRTMRKDSKAKTAAAGGQRDMVPEGSLTSIPLPNLYLIPRLQLPIH